MPRPYVLSSSSGILRALLLLLNYYFAFSQSKSVSSLMDERAEDNDAALHAVLLRFAGTNTSRANNYPFVSLRTDARGVLLPATCVAQLDSPACADDLITMSSHAIVPRPHPLARVPTQHAFFLYQHFVEKAVTDPVLISEQNQLFSKATDKIIQNFKASGRKSLIDDFVKFVNHYFSLSRKISSILMLHHVGTFACGEYAAMSYAQILKFQKLYQDAFNIHFFLVKSKVTDENHVFIVVKANLAEQSYADFRFSDHADELKGAIVVDPYLGAGFSFVPYGHSSLGAADPALQFVTVERLPTIVDLTWSRGGVPAGALAVFDEFLSVSLAIPDRTFPDPFDPDLPFNKQDNRSAFLAHKASSAAVDVDASGLVTHHG